MLADTFQKYLHTVDDVRTK